ncbi:MAG: hypothetical protein PSW75_03630 [bacterium]|nr:hypothetical protein [bacterium]MDI1336806.1 hypothetical protein [Lacunisphaera sp.]
MMRLLLSLLLLGSLALPAQAASKANTINLRPGDVIYARFESNGKKIKLAGATKEKDEAAQIIFTLTRDKESLDLKLKVENKFPKDFVCEVVLRSKRLDRESPAEVLSVVGGKLAFETFSALTDELIVSGFKLER